MLEYVRIIDLFKSSTIDQWTRCFLLWSSVKYLREVWLRFILLIKLRDSGSSAKLLCKLIALITWYFLGIPHHNGSYNLRAKLAKVCIEMVNMIIANYRAFATYRYKNDVSIIQGVCENVVISTPILKPIISTYRICR